MPEEIDLTEEEEEILDEVWKEIREEEEERDNNQTLLSTDIHGREHIPAGSSRGGQFVSARRDTPTQTVKTTSSEARYIHIEAHKSAVKKAIRKYKHCPLPTTEEIEAASAGVKRMGANKFRKNIQGNTRNRRQRRNKLLSQFGDGTTCPCVYCGLVITHGTMEQDKIYPTMEGGRYRTPNLVPSCGDCNKKRGDMPFEEAIRKTVEYVRHRANSE